MTDLLGSSTTAGTGGSFPGATGSSTSTLMGGFNSSAVTTMTTAEFLQDYAHFGVTSSNIGLFIDSSTGHPNQQGVYLAWYASLGQSERQTIQESMAAAGLMTASASNSDGTPNSTSNGAFIGLLGDSQSQGFDALQYLDAQSTGTNALQNEISSSLATAQKNATAPETVTETNPNQLAADITTAFDNALGYAPDQAQIQSFISQIQGQETAYAEAPRTEAQDQINQAESEESALNKLGANGIDTVIQAYAAAVSGTKMPGAGTTQGPSIGPGTLPASAAEGPYLPGQNPNAPVSSAVSVPKGPQPEYFTAGNQLYQEPTKNANGTITPAPGSQAAKTTPPSRGGLYALSSSDWTEAQKLYAPAQKYTTPGAAPQSVQLGAFTQLLQNAYDNNGQSWSKAVTSIAAGTPLATSEGSHLSTFAAGVANEVNSQIAALQNEVNNTSVTVKVAAPDTTGAYSAEAAAAAKQADPVGYYAANYASGSELLNQMLAGAPLMYDYNTSDTFSGPVPTAAAVTPTAAPAAQSNAAPSTVSA